MLACVRRNVVGLNGENKLADGSHIVFNLFGINLLLISEVDSVTVSVREIASRKHTSSL